MADQWELWLRKNAPALAAQGSNQNQVAMQNYNANADVGYYENYGPQAPQLPPQKGYTSGLTMPDLDKVNQEVFNQNQPQAQAQPNKWQQFGNNFMEVLPSLLTAYAIYKDKDGTGSATAVKSYLDAKQQQVENGLRERQWQAQQDQTNWERQRAMYKDQYEQDIGNKTLKQGDRKIDLEEQKLTGDNEYRLNALEANTALGWGGLNSQQNVARINGSTQENVATINGDTQRDVAEINARNKQQLFLLGLDDDGNPLPTKVAPIKPGQHYNNVSALARNYKRPSDLLADMDRHAQELIVLMGKGNYDKLYDDTKKKVVTNDVNPNYKKGSQSPIRTYLLYLKKNKAQ